MARFWEAPRAKPIAMHTTAMKAKPMLMNSLIARWPMPSVARPVPPRNVFSAGAPQTVPTNATSMKITATKCHIAAGRILALRGGEPGNPADRERERIVDRNQVREHLDREAYNSVSVT